MPPDIRTARHHARALMNFAENLRVIDKDRYATVAATIEQHARSAFNALEAAPVVAQDMVGSHDE